MGNQNNSNINFLKFINFKNENYYFYLFGILILILNISTYFSLKYIFIISEKISKRLCDLQLLKYLSQDFILSSSDIVSDITVETYRFTRQVLIPYLTFLSRSFCIISILIILSIINFQIILLLTLTISSIILIILKFNKKNLFLIGEKIRESNKKRINILTEILSNFSIIKIFNLEKNFFENFRYKGQEYFSSQSKNSYLIVKQKYILECIFYATLSLGLIFFKDQISNNLNFVSVLIYAFIRTMPHFQACIVNLASAKSHFKSGMILLGKISKKNKVSKIKRLNIDKFHKLKIENLNFKYLKNEKIFNNTRFVIENNDRIFLKGESGSGKTTLINIIVGTLIPEKKTKYILNNKLISQNKYNGIREYIGYVPQEPLIFDNNLYYNITLKEKKDLSKDKKYEEIINKVGIQKFNHRLSKKMYDYRLHEKGRNLSVGQKQKICLARALYKNPKILIFDETFNSIDLLSRNQIFNIINKLKDCSIICISHHQLKKFKFNKKLVIRDKKIVNEN